MRLLVLLSMTVLLAGCANSPNYANSNPPCPKNNHAKYAQKGTLAYDQYGCPIGADPSPQVRHSLWRDKSDSD